MDRLDCIVVGAGPAALSASLPKVSEFGFCIV